MLVGSTHNQNDQAYRLLALPTAEFRRPSIGQLACRPIMSPDGSGEIDSDPGGRIHLAIVFIELTIPG
jgi:hypothetical protein